MFQKQKKQMMSLALATSLVFAPATSVFATETAVDDSSVLVVGAALNEVQIAETAEVLGVADDASLTIHKVTGADIEQFIGQSGVSDSQMISSVLVNFQEEGGIETHIATPENITAIKSYQYSNAAITAGIYDSIITVASISPVTGESALTGVYKAAEVYGLDLDEDSMIAGNEELETVQEIEENNENNEDFESEDFSQALTQIKVEIANQVNNSSTSQVTTNDIVVTINNVLQQYNINIPEADVNRLAESLSLYKDTLTDEKVDQIKDQLEEFGKKTWNMAGDLFEDAKEAGVFDRIGQFFRDLFNAIIDLFRSNSSEN